MAGQLDALQKLPPQSVEMEQSVLGAILQDNHALVRVLEILQERDFYQDAHRWIFQTMVDLFQDNVPIDVLTVTERLRKKGRFEAAGGAAYLVDLVEMVPTAAHVLHHAQVVREKAVLRALIQTATTLTRSSIGLSRRSLRSASAKRPPASCTLIASSKGASGVLNSSMSARNWSLVCRLASPISIVARRVYSRLT